MLRKPRNYYRCPLPVQDFAGHLAGLNRLKSPSDLLVFFCIFYYYHGSSSSFFEFFFLLFIFCKRCKFVVQCEINHWAGAHGGSILGPTSKIVAYGKYSRPIINNLSFLCRKNNQLPVLVTAYCKKHRQEHKWCEDIDGRL